MSRTPLPGDSPRRRRRKSAEPGIQRISIVIRGSETRVVVANALGQADSEVSSRRSHGFSQWTWTRLRKWGQFTVGAATLIAAVVTVWALVR